MPYTLINQLKTLMQMDFPSQTETATPCLNTAFNLPEEVLNQVDLIERLARNLFGARIEPNFRQATIMAEHGFPIERGETIACVWRSGTIRTPKGFITYR